MYANDQNLSRSIENEIFECKWTWLSTEIEIGNVDQNSKLTKKRVGTWK